MHYLQTINVIVNNREDDSTLFSLSDEFLEAARLLQTTSPTRVNYSTAVYYLLGHSAELMLKAFLYKHGKTIGQLKKSGHDLKELIRLSIDSGLPESVNIKQILRLSDAYNNKRFEYRTRDFKRFPNLDLLTQDIKLLQSIVFDRICDLSDKQ